MNLSLPGQTRGAKVGNLYGWALGFLADGAASDKSSFLLTSNDYNASIEAVLPSSFSGGRVQVVIEALTDAHYGKILGMKAADLFLFWQDVNASFLSFAAGITGLAGLGGGPSAAELAPALVTRFAFTMKRRPGARAYETVLDGRDNAFQRLTRTLAPRACYQTMAAALAALGTAASVTLTPEPDAATLLGQVLADEDEITDSATANQTCAGAIATIAARIVAGSQANPNVPALRSDAPSIVLLRDGAVHVGRRPIPFPAGSDPKVLDAGTGLADATREGEAGDTAPVRWTLLCRGRPDIKPGDVVRFKSPVEDVISTLPSAAMALFGALAGPILGAIPEDPDTRVLVTDVSHRMSRTAGFTTSVAGNTIDDLAPASPPWAPFQVTEDGPVPARTSAGGDAAVAVGRQVRDLARATLGRIRLPEVAEVRSAVSKAGSPPAEPPAQTVTVWEGTGGSTGQANPSRRLPVARAQPIERRGVATLTPFAWGGCGLAVPRYPGMRVMLSYGNGLAQDPVDLGALWGPAARMDAEPGDWWLKLPVDQPTAALSDIADHLPSGEVTNDLTDAAGVRVIEAGKLTIRVGKPLSNITARPAHTAKQAVSIQHADGMASITIDQDGAITITGKTIAIDAGSSGTVSITAKDVTVSVGNQMTVS